LLGDATDEELLEQENIAEMDLFLAVTNDDEDNIMSGSWPSGWAASGWWR
jgi:trk system potassium uptake protein TrkA